MVSRAIGIGLVVTLALALVGGSAYILLRPAEAAEGHSSAGQSQGQGRTTNPSSQDGSVISNGNGNGAGNSGRTDQGPAWGQGQGRSQGAGGGGIGREREPGNPLPHEAADYLPESWVTISGSVVSLDHDLTLETDTGEMTVHVGPEWYWEAQGILLSPGDRVVVSGFYESREGMAEPSFEVGRIESLTTGEAVSLRDDSGHPLWAGRGRRGG
ncbi:MAG TPA: hypothetical protein ENN99_05040 [Chloroflexi bacterium]|nr:hypothetical protein [Chloroflexota bacterium]